MVPLVGTVREFNAQAAVIRGMSAQVFAERGEGLDYLLGTMIETPRAALVADSIGKQAEFFSFGTNDLTQMTIGFSRDDAGKFLPEYLKQGHVRTRSVPQHRPERRGPAGGDGGAEGPRDPPGPRRSASAANTAATRRSVAFFHRAGLDYVSCSPFRVPIARLAAAQAAIGD